MQENITHEIIKDIKSQFRLYMNGAISQSMRKNGLDYKINFGIEYPRLKEIATMYQPDHEVAQTLWKENIRECKILATLLQPAETFYREIADIWIESMEYPELAEYATINLFQRLPYASEAVFQWIADERPYFQLCGYLLMARLLMNNHSLNERAEAEFLDQASAALQTDLPMVQKAACAALRKFAGQQRENAKKLARLIRPLCETDKGLVTSLAEQIRAEIEYR